MKVKQLVEMLQQLEQEKEIHLVYDCCYELSFEIEIADASYPDSVNEGDYVICAG